MIVGVDVDDVVANLVDEWLKRYRDRTGDNIYPENIRGWDIGSYCQKMTKDAFYAILHEPDLYASVKPHAHAVSTIGQLRAMDHRIVFVTSCVGRTVADKKQWLVDHGFLPAKRKHDDFIAAHDKSLVAGCDVLFDDRVENVERFPNKAILIRRAHNEDLSCWRPRANLWDVPEILEHL